MSTLRPTLLLLAALLALPAMAQRPAEAAPEAALYRELLAHANTLKVVDAHEHLLSPEDHAQQYLSFWNFFSDYVVWDLYGAGMPQKLMRAKPKNEAEVTALFDAIEPYLAAVEHGSYMRSVRVTLQRFFGVDRITRENHLDITRRLNANNSAEHYRKVLKDAGIVKILQQPYQSLRSETPWFVNQTPLTFQFQMEREFSALGRKNPRAKLKDVVALYEAAIQREREAGSVGIKFFPHVFTASYDPAAAEREYQQIKQGKRLYTQFSQLARYLYEEQIRIATDNDMVVAIHVGVWGDLTDKTPALLFPIVKKYPFARFDVYHMGIPYMRETAFLGKNYPNVYLNLCWAYAVSESMVLNSLDEWLDVVPTNKIIGFGGDLQSLPEHVVGMLDVAKHTLATALARRIARERLDMPGAKKILEDWLFNNPARLYRLILP
jgi:predicted TIM-barrel fold metal-dependent hydrolase